MTRRNSPETARPATKTARKGKDTRPAPVTWQTARCEATAIGWLFVLPVLLSANRQWRRGKRKDGTSYTFKPKGDKAVEAAAAALFRHVPMFRGEVCVSILWVRRQASGDVDNRVKPTLDLLKGVAFADDDQVRRVEVERTDDRTKAPGLYVSVWAADEPRVAA